MGCETLLVLRLALHLVAALVIVFYVGNPNRQRYGIAFIASCLAGTSTAFAVHIITQWDELVSGPVQAVYLVFAAVFCVLCVRARGNVADLFAPRRRR